MPAPHIRPSALPEPTLAEAKQQAWVRLTDEQQQRSSTSRSSASPTGSSSTGEYSPTSEQRPRKMFGPYVLLETLGNGEFGKVKRATHQVTGKEVALKLINKRRVETAELRDKVDREVTILKQLSHPSIVRLLDVIESEKYTGLVLQYAAQGELFEHILARDYLEEAEARNLFGQLVSGVQYLQKKGVVHRDLKLENLLLLDERTLIITDFGFANQKQEQQKWLMTTCCGSPCYAAPELLRGETYVGPAADIWSCGVVLYAMLCGFLPFNDEEDYSHTTDKQKDGGVAFPEHMYDKTDAQDLIRRMLEPDPTKRFTVRDILDHPWMMPKEEQAKQDVSENSPSEGDQHHHDAKSRENNVKQPQNDRSSISSPSPAVPAKPSQHEPPKLDQDLNQRTSFPTSSSEKTEHYHKRTTFESLRRLLTSSGHKKRSTNGSKRFSWRWKHRASTRVQRETLLLFNSRVTPSKLEDTLQRVVAALGFRTTHDNHSPNRLVCERPAKDARAMYTLNDSGKVVFTIEWSVVDQQDLRVIEVKRIEGQVEAYDFLCAKVLDVLEIAFGV
ncbi:kinase-like domain-containing protein [Syncephalastrum racemosum]|uniref:Kinase-like domain-containing protein n=1 Tax=Syncephalastrum racemosum TaxID=13706 RepID=A0A1X2H2V6_SYNRA|nr:kinase-like domain-containing protein [Syncephalastrum racemosum]